MNILALYKNNFSPYNSLCNIVICFSFVHFFFAGRMLLLLSLLVVTSWAIQCTDSSSDETCLAQSDEPTTFDQEKDWAKAKTIYEFKARDIEGKEVSFDRYRGHVAIIVNVASKCGLTDTNYKELVELYKKYKDTKGLRILAFPSNEFGGQEPGTAQEIQDFVTEKYGVTFDMFEKVHVSKLLKILQSIKNVTILTKVVFLIQVNGDNAHPLWKWLKEKQGGFLTDGIKWNFTKFLVDKNGNVVGRFAPSTSPSSIEDELEKLFQIPPKTSIYAGYDIFL